MSRVPSLTHAIMWLAISSALLGFRCGETSAPSSVLVAPKPKPKPKPELRLMLLSDPRGYLEPCGCQQRPLGGVDKLAASVAKARAEGIPLLVLAAGDLSFGTTLHGDDAASARTQELWRAETLIDAWNAIGIDAVTPGGLDFAMGLEVQRALAARSKFPWLADNLSVDDLPKTGTTRGRIFDVGSNKVGVLGLIAPSPTLPETLRIDPDLRGSAKRAVTALRAQGAALVVALVSGDRRAARQIAGAGADFVLMGGLDQEEPLAPLQHEGATLLHAGRQGQRVLTLDVALSAGGVFHDASTWSVETKKREAQERAKDLEARIRDWEQDPRTKPADLAAQRARLAELRAELQVTHTPSYEGRWFAASILELSPDIQGEPAIAARMDAMDKRINEHNREALKDRKPAPAKAGSAAFAGSESCKTCHAAAYTWWRTTKHGTAYQTLEAVNKQFSLACVGCHVTGYNEPGGSTVTHVETLKDVGCENCHGPSSLHNTEPTKPGLVRRDTTAATCEGCHNREHSARFQYEAFKSLLIVPGHGLPAANAERTK